MATGMCYPKYQILYVLKSKECLLHPATMLQLLVSIILHQYLFVANENGFTISFTLYLVLACLILLKEKSIF